MSKIIKTGGGNGEAKPRVGKKLIVFVVIALALFTLVGFVWSKKYVRDNIAFFLDPSSGVCSDDKTLISSYNDVSQGNTEEEFGTFIKLVKSKPGYEKDATCVYMVFRFEAGFGTLAQAKSSLKDLRTLLGDGKKINSFISDGVNRGELYKELDSLRENTNGVEG